MLEKVREQFADDTRAQGGNLFAGKTIAQGLMLFVLLIIILNEFLTIGVVNNTNGPFSVDSVVNIGQAAIGIAVLGILVLAGAVAMRYMDRF